MKILAVDDEKIALENLKRSIKKSGPASKSIWFQKS